MMRLWLRRAAMVAMILPQTHCTALECMTCVEAKGSWQVGMCHPKDLGDCPVADAGCCTETECCVTSGCRSPEDLLVGSWDPAAHPVSCHRCCEEVSEGCKFRTYVDGAATHSKPHYNSEEVVLGNSCAEVWPDPSITCPPCAYCDTRTEEEVMKRMHECHCETVRAECHEPTSCECYCHRQAVGLERCPHLTRQLRSEL